MSAEYTRSVLRIVVGQICQTIGWHSINSTPLEFLVDLMEEYISRIYRLSHQYAETLNRTEGNLDDVGLAFRHLGIDVQQLAEYVRNVDSVPCVVQVPRYPIPRENHLNFLKPGSREVVTRPVHIHEHLPAMYPEAEQEEEQDQQSQRDQQEKTRFPDERSEKDEDNSPDRLRSMSDVAAPIDYPQNVHNHSPEGVFKRPCDPLAEGSPVLKRMKLLETNSESRPLREIHSVMMTTSGFLSPAREGKLPEPRTPIQARPDSPPAPSYPMVPPEIVKSDNPKKIKKAMKKNTNVNSTTSTIATTSTLTPAATTNNNSSNNNTSSNCNNSNNKNNNGHSNNNITIDDKKLDKENKKMNNKNRERDILFKADKITEVKVKKNAAKETNKPVKSLKPPGSGKRRSESISPPPIINEKDDPLSSRAGSIKDISPKFRGGEKIVTSPCPPMDKLQRDVCDKLPSEPDKQKLNIFKKISKPRDEMKSNDVTDHHQHHHSKYKNIESRENSPGLMIDEPNNTRCTDFDRKQHMVHTPEPTTAAGSYNNGIYNVPSPGSDIAIYDDSSLPPTPRTPDVPAPPVISPQNETKVSHSNNKKRKEKISKKKSDNAKATSFKDSTLHKHKGLNDMLDGGCETVLGRPKTPEPLDTTMRKGPPPYGGLPYYSGVFPGVPAPGLIPTGPGLIPTGPSLIPPLFPRFPMPPLGRGVQPPSIPNNLPSMMPGRPPFLPPGNMKIDDYSSSSRTKIPTDPLGLDPSSSLKNDFEKGDKMSRNSKERISPLPPTVPTMKNPPPPRFDSFASISAAAGAATNMSGATTYAGHQPFMDTLEKMEKVEKKPKKHKVDKKDKMKKKKEKKEKHKDKLEKSKESKREKLDKIKEKKEKKEKRKDKEDKLEKEGGEGVPKITLKLGKSSPRPPTPDNPLMKKITIKPLVKKPEDIVKREASPELAKISALVTRPPKPKVPKMKEKKEEAKIDVHHHNHQSAGAFVERPPVTIVDGHQVWICPGCGKQDDGSPMVGCDDCDAWYHWVCVGMQVPPAEDENWYCKMCINKQQELHHDKKKKKRKKKVKIST